MSTKTRTRKKCTAHGLAMMSFVSPLLRGGQIGVATSDEGPPSHETRLKSALGLRSVNATNNIICVAYEFSCRPSNIFKVLIQRFTVPFMYFECLCRELLRDNFFKF